VCRPRRTRHPLRLPPAPGLPRRAVALSAFAPRFTITNAVTGALTAIERARGFLEAATLSEAWIERMSRQALLLEAHHTTHIEGTQLTLEESARLWAGEQVPTASHDDARELLNYRGAFNLVSEYLDSGEPITEGLIREIHKRLVEGVRGGEGGPGAYRRVQNYVVNSATREVMYTPPPPEDVTPLMRHLVVWLRADTDLHPVLVAGIAQYQLVHIHPFLDGNGRTSRLLSTLCLYRTGYDFKRLFTLSQFYDRDRPAFYRAIRSVAERDMDLTGWLEFFVGGLAIQLGEIITSGKRVMLSHLIAGRYGLNERQASIVELLLEQPEVRIEDVEGRLPKANRRTLQRDLQHLVRRRIVKSSGAARTVRYQLKIKGLATNRDRIATRIATTSRRES
jgi:Fic family protein